MIVSKLILVIKIKNLLEKGNDKSTISKKLNLSEEKVGGFVNWILENESSNSLVVVRKRTLL